MIWPSTITKPRDHVLVPVYASRKSAVAGVLVVAMGFVWVRNGVGGNMTSIS